MSLAGKTQVFKALIILKPITMQHVPNDTLSDLRNLHKKFILEGKWLKIKYCTLIGEYEEGGLKDMDIEAIFLALNIIQARRGLWGSPKGFCS